MQTRTLVVWITFLAVFTMAARMSVDTDTWWHFLAGEWMVENRQILQVGVLSHTRYGEPWRYPGWLVEIPMYWIYRLAGPGGLNLWTAAMVTLAFAFIWRVQSGSSYLRAFITVLAAAASGVYWAARPYLVTFVLVAVFLYLLEHWRWHPGPKHERWLWLLPVLMVLWANSHGGFFAGFLLLAVYLAGEGWGWLNAVVRQRSTPNQHLDLRQQHALRLRRLIWISLLTLLGACLTPVGPRLLLYPIQTVEIAALQAYIQEWQAPDFHNLSMQPFLWLLLALYVIVRRVLRWALGRVSAMYTLPILNAPVRLGAAQIAGLERIPAVVRETIKRIGYINAEYGFDYQTCLSMVVMTPQVW